MALYLKVSNSLNSLAQGLSQDLQAAGNSVFQPHYIITQTEGMNNWLKLQLAYQLGIAANCRFMKPNDLLHQLYMMLGGPYTAVLSPQNLSWLLFKLLGEKAFTEKYPDTAAYYQDQGPDSALKRMSLAERVADLFDQYQVYRPDMIQEWTRADVAAMQQADWQQWLWMKIKTMSGKALPDKTIIGAYILDTLRINGPKVNLASRIPAIHLFGLSIITAYHVKILHELSAYIDVYFHIINPAPAVFWFDDKNEKQLARWRQKGLQELAANTAGNTLLTGWGSVIQNSFGLFFAYDAFLNAYEDIDIVEPEPDSLLHKIQHDIFMAATNERQPLSLEDTRDGSVTINSCYTIAREVEVLYNYLVHLVDQRHEALSPRDIVVMVSDIDAYAPYIKAVFNHAPYRFRYTIADESYTDNDNLFNALHAILTVTADNFKAETVIQLLDFSYIRKRFALQDPLRIRAIVQAANIRFGIEGDKTEETHFVSWRYGIQRIMYGICMSGNEEYGTGADSFFPLDQLEGSDAHEIIRFCHFAAVLMDSIEDRTHDRSIAEWVTYAERLLHNLVFEPQEEVDEDYTTLMKELTDYNTLNEYMDDKISFEVFNHSFLQTLTGTTRAGLFVNGGITFCSLIPMRSIPFKVVALMGLNYDKFPRRENKSSFNLMEQQRQRGDRNVKENDKHLFLETVLSAQNYLYISYVGKNAKDNTIQPPSALVDELVDYIEAGTDPAEQSQVRSLLITQQPLQGFSRKYATGNDQLFSYLNNNTLHKKTVLKEQKITDPLNFDEITLDELVSFFRNPFRAYYNKVLGIYYNNEQILLKETELFSLDNLDQWDIKNRLLPVAANETGILQKMLVRKGRLPLSNMATVALHQVEELVVPVRALYDTLTKGTEEKRLPVELSVDGSLLKGTIPQVFDDKFLQVSWSKKETKYLIAAYIRYLAGTAAGVLTGMHFISGTKKEAVFAAVPLSQQTAQHRLQELVRLYKSGFSKMLPFYPDFETEPAELDTLGTDKFLVMISKKLESNTDPYIMQEYEKGFFEEEDTLAAYKAICQLLITPLATIFPEYYV
ncbi:exodeoxyribonuclease V subunit gamma [Chitinophaga nivalis]|uniref:RecBCD enzyme subunit RecC n=1 Tax=Chitinophaga nivalis TaxID=2991709 RepID=A0ABT3IUP4_9BACT|nr:exodeoxyribonuclease V subunit gamma [Chitinophaga nivalis]MCW3462595.1 exodeoxyribonuclease V subunit gamma [Chitinophaga nivalis]MCW3487714.1 exodeoxyribonuclease V subunit gamma [Chitinophaga nivalis]